MSALTLLCVLLVAGYTASLEPVCPMEYLQYSNMHRMDPAFNRKTLYGHTRDQCGERCKTESDFECRSYTHSYIRRICHLHTVTLASPGVGSLQREFLTSYYERTLECYGCPLTWMVIAPLYTFEGYTPWTEEGLSFVECFNKCSNFEYRCMSIAYNHIDKVCGTSSVGRADRPSTQYKKDNSFIYAERIQMCAGCELGWAYRVSGYTLVAAIASKVVTAADEDSCKVACEQLKEFVCLSCTFHGTKCHLNRLRIVDTPGLFKRKREHVYNERGTECQVTNTTTV